MAFFENLPYETDANTYKLKYKFNQDVLCYVRDIRIDNTDVAENAPFPGFSICKNEHMFKFLPVYDTAMHQWSTKVTYSIKTGNKFLRQMTVFLRDTDLLKSCKERIVLPKVVYAPIMFDLINDFRRSAKKTK